MLAGKTGNLQVASQHMAHCGRKRQTYKFRRTLGMQRGIHDDVLACTKRPLIFRRVPCNILDHDVLFLFETSWYACVTLPCRDLWLKRRYVELAEWLAAFMRTRRSSDSVRAPWSGCFV